MTETIFMWAVVISLVVGFHYVFEVLKDIRDALETILGEMQGGFDHDHDL